MGSTEPEIGSLGLAFGQAMGDARIETVSPPAPGTWQEQYERVARWLNRLGDTYVGRLHDSVTEAYEDEVYAFFQNYYHLKDWLKNDPASAEAVADIETLITRSRIRASDAVLGRLADIPL